MFWCLLRIASRYRGLSALAQHRRERTDRTRLALRVARPDHHRLVANGVRHLGEHAPHAVRHGSHSRLRVRDIHRPGRGRYHTEPFAPPKTYSVLAQLVNRDEGNERDEIKKVIRYSGLFRHPFHLLHPCREHRKHRGYLMSRLRVEHSLTIDRKNIKIFASGKEKIWVLLGTKRRHEQSKTWRKG